MAREVDALAGSKPIEWRLLSNRRAASLAQAQKIDIKRRCGIVFPYSEHDIIIIITGFASTCRPYGRRLPFLRQSSLTDGYHLKM